MHVLFRALLLIVLLATATGMSASVQSVRRAQAKLGADVWTRALEIENTAPTAIYPKTTYALVFELNRVLWIYTPNDGTQSLSLYRGRLARDQADLLPLLKEIHRGFSNFKVIAEAEVVIAGEATPLPNGCFVDSVAAARAQSATGQQLLRAGILLYYAKGTSQQGHAVFAYETPSGVYIDDTARTQTEKLLGKWSDEPLTLACRYLPEMSGKLVTARFLPVTFDAPASNIVAASSQGKSFDRG